MPEPERVAAMKTPVVDATAKDALLEQDGPRLAYLHKRFVGHAGHELHTFLTWSPETRCPSNDSPLALDCYVLEIGDEEFDPRRKPEAVRAINVAAKAPGCPQAASSGTGRPKVSASAPARCCGRRANSAWAQAENSSNRGLLRNVRVCETGRFNRRAVGAEDPQSAGGRRVFGLT